MEAVHGFIVRRAADHGVPVPTQMLVYGLLKAMDRTFS